MPDKSRADALAYFLDGPEGRAGALAWRFVIRIDVVESLLKGSNDADLVDVWLTEGIAEYVAGGTAGGSVTDLASFEGLIATYGELNPVAMRGYRYPDIEVVAFH